jgi:hypothetical protein
MPWNVTLDGSRITTTTALIVDQVVNGTYSYTVGTTSGYSTLPSTGTIAVAGQSVSSVVLFRAGPAISYPVQFNISAFSGNQQADWNSESYLNLSGGIGFSSLNDSIRFAVPNGTYGFTVATGNSYWAPAFRHGSFTVSGEGRWFTLVYNAVYFNLSFNESGLPGTLSAWGMNYTVCPGSGSTICQYPPPFSDQTTIGCAGYGTTCTSSARNGSFVFIVSPKPDYSASPATGAVIVHGSDVTVPILFTPNSVRLYTMTFAETGFSPGPQWWVTIREAVEWSNATNAQFTDPNGTYAYSVHSPAGFVAQPSAGNASINGTNVTIQLSFTGLPRSSAQASGPVQASPFLVARDREDVRI